MKKRIFNAIFIIFLLILYFGKDYFYSFLSEEISFEVLSDYEKINDNDFYYESDIFNYEITKVLYRDIYDFSNEITILKGEDYEFSENYPVVDENALIGYISYIDNTSSKVTLLTNKNISISIKVGDSYGILKYVDGKISITNLTSEDFSVGDYIYTSGYSKIYEGILIGEVLEKNYSSLEIVYNVNLFGEFNDINYLVVIKDLK